LACPIEAVTHVSMQVPGLKRPLFACPRWTGPSTNASRQPEKPENWYSKTWGSASTLGLSSRPRAVSFPTGENAGRAKSCRMWRIQATVVATAAVKIMGLGIWYVGSMAPHKTRYQTTSPGRKWLNIKGEWMVMREAVSRPSWQPFQWIDSSDTGSFRQRPKP